MDLPLDLQQAQAHTRRHFFGQAGLGFGAIALQQLLARNGYAAEEKPSFRIPPKAKSVIYLHMAGSPSQIDLFEHKPALTKFHGKDCPQEYLEGKRFAFIKGTPKMLGPVFDYKQHGQSGQWISELLPGLSSVVDDVCMIRSIHTEQFNHSPAQLLLHTGNPLLGYPSMGSWVTYGLGSENENLPGFVVLASGGKTPSAGSLSGVLVSCLRSIRVFNVVRTGEIRFFTFRTRRDLDARLVVKPSTPSRILTNTSTNILGTPRH